MWADLHGLRRAELPSQAADPAALQRTLALYRGPFLAGEPGAWAAPFRERLRAQHARLVERLGAMLDGAGMEPAAVDQYLRAMKAATLQDDAGRALSHAARSVGRGTRHSSSGYMPHSYRIGNAPNRKLAAALPDMAARRTIRSRNAMPIHTSRFTDSDWRPHPSALVVYVAAMAVLAWSAHDFAETESGQGGSGPRSDPWRPATSKWSRATTAAAPAFPTSSMPVYAGVSAMRPAGLTPGAGK